VHANYLEMLDKKSMTTDNHLVCRLVGMSFDCHRPLFTFGEVKREDGSEIKGLYAAGRTAVGVCSSGVSCPPQRPGIQPAGKI
jgi:hypothetical protein